MQRRELSRRIADFDDGGTPAWRQRHRVINAVPKRRSFWRLMAGRRWERWNALQRVGYSYLFPFIFAFWFLVGAAVVFAILAILSVI